MRLRSYGDREEEGRGARSSVRCKTIKNEKTGTLEVREERRPYVHAVMHSSLSENTGHLLFVSLTPKADGPGREGRETMLLLAGSSHAHSGSIANACVCVCVWISGPFFTPTQKVRGQLGSLSFFFQIPSPPKGTRVSSVREKEENCAQSADKQQSLP